MVVGGRCYPYVLLLSSSISNDLIPHVPPAGQLYLTNVRQKYQRKQGLITVTLDSLYCAL